jgi:hypothetical protein|nr:MAG TPA: hypothetical protein [Caudoviricetes sp.]
MDTFTKKNIVIPFYGRLKQGKQRHEGHGRLYLDVIDDAFYIKKVFFKKLDKLQGRYYKDEVAFENFYINIISKEGERVFDAWLKDIKSSLKNHQLLKYLEQIYNKNLIKQEVSQ